MYPIQTGTNGKRRKGLWFWVDNSANWLGQRCSFIAPPKLFVIFASGPAIGAGLAVMVEVLEHNEKQKRVILIAALLIFLTPFFNLGVPPIAAILVVSVLAKSPLADTKQ